MKAAIITEKIKRLLNSLKGICGKIKPAFSALLAGIASLFGSLKSKNRQSKNRVNVRGAAKDRQAKGKNAEVSSFFTRFRGSLIAKIDYLSERFFGRFPAGKRRQGFLVFSGACIFFLILIISIFVMNTGKSEKNNLPGKMAGIPNEELFSPSEPDFLPGFIFEREPRRFWTIEDVRPYWKIPGNAEYWNREIKTAADKLLEGVP